MAEPAVVPLSWNQRHRLGQTAVDTEAGVYHPHHSVQGMRFTGALDVAALDESWREVQLRHPALLSTVQTDEEQWRIGERKPDGLVELPAQPDRVAAEAALRQYACEPFDLANGPLARMALVDAGGQERLAAVVCEHLVCDAWSRGIVLTDLLACYERRAGAGEVVSSPDGLPPARIIGDQYAYLDSATGKRAMARVTARLGSVGAVPDTPLRGFTGHQPVHHDRLARLTRTLDADRYSRLAPVAQATRLTRLNLVLAAVHAAIAELSGLPEVATSLVTANRHHPATHPTVGWFASKLIVPSRPRAFHDIRDYLAAFRAEVIEAFDGAKLPWPAVLAEVTPQLFGRFATTPFVSFNAQPARMRQGFRPRELPGLLAEELPISVARNDAAIATYWAEDDGLQVTINYKTEWYTETDVAAFWDEIVAKVDHIAAHGSGRNDSA